MKTTIDLPDALYESIRKRAVAENKPLGEWIVELVEKVVFGEDEEVWEWGGELLK